MKRATGAGTAKPRPSLPPEPVRMKVLMPTTSPSAFTSGPPLLPGLMGASVWMNTKGESRSICRALDHVRVGDDISAGIDDHARPDHPLVRDHGGSTAFVRGHRPVAGDQDLHHRGRDAAGKLRQRAVQLAEDAGRLAHDRGADLG